MTELDTVMSKLEELEQKIEENRKIIKGGKQPDDQLVIKKNGGAGHKVIALIMKEARQGQRLNGCSRPQASQILRNHNKERSNQAVRDMLKSISAKFPDFDVKPGKGSKPMELIYDP